jgi:hypothetical protein
MNYYIKMITSSDWTPTIKSTVYDIARFAVFFYVCGAISKQWLIKLNNDTTKIFLSLIAKFNSN